MKKTTALLLAAAVLFSLPACGKKSSSIDFDASQYVNTTADNAPSVYCVDINSNNFWDYFEYHEYKSTTKEDDGTTSSASILYGYKLKDWYHAEASGEYMNTLKVSFRATGVVNSGQFTVNYNTLEWSGTTQTSQRLDITDTLTFWPKGDRTELYPYGVYNSMYIIYLENFTLTDVTGTIYLTNDPVEE